MDQFQDILAKAKNVEELESILEEIIFNLVDDADFDPEDVNRGLLDAVIQIESTSCLDILLDAGWEVSCDDFLVALESKNENMMKYLITNSNPDIVKEISDCAQNVENS